MTTLLELRKRIRTTQNVEQITRAMEAVATAQLKVAAKKVGHSSRYEEYLQGILTRLAASSEGSQHPMLFQRPVKTMGLVVITGDKGLSGPYNDHILSAAEQFLVDNQNMPIELILIGKKAVGHFKKQKWKIRSTLVNWSGKLNHDMVQKLSQELSSAFLSEELDQIMVTYTHFQSLLVRKVATQQYLPIPAEGTKSHNNYILEPSAERVLEGLLPQYCLSRIQRLLDEAYTSELASRAFSMRKATNNAKEMLGELVLVSNKIRQSGITREMIEIAAGIEGVS